jgi:hypothetical protein
MAISHRITPADIEAALRRIDAGEGTSDDANMLRAYIDSLNRRLEQERDDPDMIRIKRNWTLMDNRSILA